MNKTLIVNRRIETLVPRDVPQEMRFRKYPRLLMAIGIDMAR